MTFKEALDYLKSQGCSFTFDNVDKPVFSDTHVFYDGVEFGIMGLHNMTFYTDRTHKFLDQFNYGTMWIYGGDAKFKELVARYITDRKGELPSAGNLFDGLYPENLKEYYGKT